MWIDDRKKEVGWDGVLVRVGMGGTGCWCEGKEESIQEK